MKIKNSKVVITGASRGLGKALAMTFYNMGADVYDWSRSSGVDVTKPILRLAGDVDILICNAGVSGPLGPVESYGIRHFMQCIEVNLMGVVNCCQYVLPGMKQRRKGKIIIVAGGGATKPMANLSAYAASKTAVVRFAETLAEEVKDYGIDVNCMSPGLLKTGIHEDILNSSVMEGTDAHRAAVLAQSLPDDCFNSACSLALWLASDESNGVTGRLISAQWDDWWKIKPESIQPQQYKLVRQTT